MNQVVRNQGIKVSGFDRALRLALDRDSVREPDRDGRMRIKTAHISKACVNPYKGSEIPDWEKLGLDPNRVYQLYRDPDELERAAPTFNGVQLLREHKPVSAADAQQWDVVGTTGTEAKFTAPYLDNSLVLWTAEAVDFVESGEQKELSCGYHYRADMTPGDFNGIRFDGVMRDIVGNHVALVKDGRAGPDVVVGDSNQEIAKMTNEALAKKINAVARRTVSIQALSTYLKPRLAMDAKISLAKAFEGITGATFKASKPKIAASIRAQAKDKLAKDASLEDVEKVLDMLDGHEIGGGDAEVSEGEAKAIEETTEAISQIDPPTEDAEMEGLKGFLKEKGMGEDDINTACSMMNRKPGASDEFPPKKEGEEDKDKPKGEDAETDEEKAAKAAKEKKDAEDKAAADKAAKDKDMVTKPAMDAALATAKAETAKEVRATERAIRVALADVRPYVGELSPSLALDSADDVYRHAAVMLNIPEAKTIHASALPTVIKMQPKPGARPVPSVELGMDSAQAKSFAERFPNAARIEAA